MLERLEAPPRGLMHMSNRKWKFWFLSAVAALLCQQVVLAQSSAPPQYREEPPFDLRAGLGATGRLESRRYRCRRTSSRDRIG